MKERGQAALPDCKFAKLNIGTSTLSA